MAYHFAKEELIRVPEISDRCTMDTDLRKIHPCTLKLYPFESGVG